MKTLSILVAAYRAEKWLAECIASIQSQCLPDGWCCELLIGVDGCGATEKVARQFMQDNVKVISMAKNFGTYVTFNTLMQYATGQLICRFDADDVMRDGYLAKQINELQQGSDMTMTWSIYTDAELTPTDHVQAHPNYHPPGGLNRRGTEGQFMLRRSVWDCLGGFRPWRCAADSDFLARVRHAGFSISVVEEFLYYRRTHPDSLIAHPETNFSSVLRTGLEKIRADLVLEYQRSAASLKVTPVLGSVNDSYIGHHSDL